MNQKFKSDKFRKARGGKSKLLHLGCESCGKRFCDYQKDGPGILKRLYLDRIAESKYAGLEGLPLKKLPNLVCPNCKKLIGVPINYKKENRPAFRLFAGAVIKLK